ncbi:hypothetical protein ACPV40_19225, partial [Vibrio alfacsensis]|uniref:hypothetical protein n=1 Tax=Vibrio alfacsensis TaxID=1074311 RepID=UPI004068D2AA
MAGVKLIVILCANKALNSDPQRVAFLLRKSLCHGFGHVSLALCVTREFMSKVTLKGFILVPESEL